MPRSSLGPNGDPSAASHTVSGFDGWIRIAPICPVSGRPANCQVRPAFVDLYTPRPMITLLRIAALPVPTQTTFGSDSETSMEPIDPSWIWPSEIGVQRSPQFSVFQTPPPAPPM